MAAALFESLLINHPFLDGNKHVAFFATDIFPRLNGWKLQVEPQEAQDSGCRPNRLFAFCERVMTSTPEILIRPATSEDVEWCLRTGAFDSREFARQVP